MYLQLRLDAVVLNTLLLDSFVHRSRRSTATVDVLLRRGCLDRRPASPLLLQPCSLLYQVQGKLLVLPVHVEPLIRCSFDPDLCSSAFGVSSRFFSELFV